MAAPLPRGAHVLADLILRPAEEPPLLHDFNRDRGIPRQDVGVHHQGLHLVADILNLPDELTEAAVAEVAAAADVVERGLPRLRAAMGDSLIAMGRALRRPLEEAQKARIDESADAVSRLLGEKGKE